MSKIDCSFAVALVAGGLALALTSSAALAQQPGPGAVALRDALVPEIIQLPNGFQPEGITKGPGARAFVGTINGGGVFDVNLLTGAVDFLVQPRPDRQAIGLVYDAQRNVVIAAGGASGTASIYSAEGGDELATVQLTGEPSFINDVRVSSEAAFLTDSLRPVLYRVPLGTTGRRPGPAQEIPLSGDFQFVEGQFNANGIEVVLDGRFVLIVNSTTGELFRVDPASGDARRVALSPDDAAMNGDGLLLEGNRLLVVQNSLNQIAVLGLDSTFTSATLLETLTDDDFQVPATVASFDGFLFAANARFDEVPGGAAQPNDRFNIVRVDRP